MNIRIRGGAAALALACCGAPLAADDTPAATISVSAQQPDAHGPAGTMADHVHDAGGLMIGLSLMHDSFGGAMRRGATPLTPAEVAAAGYGVQVRSMAMDMAMLHLMFAPSDRVTLMVVPSWMKMGMTMEGLPGAMPMPGHAGHTLAPGQRMRHSVEGFGDTQAGALVSLSRKPALSAHLGLMVSVPTGDVQRKNPDGSYVHYMMQGGSGTWDLNPSLTVRGTAAGFGWGAQAGYLLRTGHANAAGFKFGDRFSATAWASRAVGERVSLAARLAYTDEGAISGHYNGPHSHASPPDRQANYGGRRLDAGLGVNTVIGRRLRFGIEGTVPLAEHVNGIQLPRRWGGSATLSALF